jgi:hypothetical protein
MKLTEEQKEQIVKAVESLSTLSVWDTCSQSVFEFQENDVNWQLQVSIVQDPDDFLERTSASISF